MLYSIIFQNLRIIRSLKDSNYFSTELELDINTESSTSQDLNSVTINFSTVLDSNYISAELGFDIDTESLSSRNLSCTNQNFSTSLKKRRNEEFLNVETHGNSGKYLSGFDENVLKLVSIIYRTIEASKIFRYSAIAEYLEIFNVKKSVESR
ncbi:unnamed protein product [Rhizophagus irregularis]|nr:unnamed protein product [Rhizophagus irregularis]CAB4479657.1 unnamed protein product [Rhizophagus irregularis]